MLCRTFHSIFFQLLLNSNFQKKRVRPTLIFLLFTTLFHSIHSIARLSLSLSFLSFLSFSLSLSLSFPFSLSLSPSFLSLYNNAVTSPPPADCNPLSSFLFREFVKWDVDSFSFHFFTCMKFQYIIFQSCVFLPLFRDLFYFYIWYFLSHFSVYIYFYFSLKTKLPIFVPSRILKPILF